MLNQVAENRHVLLAVGSNAFLFAGSPPRHGLDAVTTLRGAQSVFGKLIEFHPMPELLIEFFEDVERSRAECVNRRILAENFQIKPVSIESDDARERLEFDDETRSVSLKPAAESLIFVPGDGNGEPKAGNVGPSALHLMREAQRFNVQIDFAIEQPSRGILSFAKTRESRFRYIRTSLSDLSSRRIASSTSALEMLSGGARRITLA